jgi:ribulose-phosphate 3-epimerase
MSVICPTVTAFSIDDYKVQLDRITSFAKRIHLDFMDGEFAPTKSPPLSQAWWPRSVKVDLHIMYKQPLASLQDIIAHHPNLVVVHEEAEEVPKLVHELHEQRIKVGIALLQGTPPEKLHQYSGVIDHVLVFSGNLGHHGGQADLGLLDKVRQIRSMWPHIEIGWDGGINAENIRVLAAAGVDVLNTGGAIQKTDDPQNAYNKLLQLLQS